MLAKKCTGVLANQSSKMLANQYRMILANQCSKILANQCGHLRSLAMRTLATSTRQQGGTIRPPSLATQAPSLATQGTIRPPSLATLALHTPAPPTSWEGGVSRHLAPPITTSATYVVPSGEHVEGELVYGRCSNVLFSAACCSTSAGTGTLQH